MISRYVTALKAHLGLDKDRVRSINHSQEYWLSDFNTPKPAAIDYLNKMYDVLQIKKEQLTYVHQQVAYTNPIEQDIQYRSVEEKHFFDSSTLFFVQTIHNVPVWHAGVSVTIKHNPARVLHSQNYSHERPVLKLPDAAHINRFKAIFDLAKQTSSVRTSSDEDHPTADHLDTFIAAKAAQPKAVASAAMKINRGRFYVYKYDASERLPDNQKITKAAESYAPHLILPVPAPDSSIQDGKYYLVAEIMFTYPLAGHGNLNWRMLIDVQTDSVLYLRCTRDALTGKVFYSDPKSSTGNLGNTTDKDNTVFDPIRIDGTLNNLSAPAMGDPQSLTGTHVRITDDLTPTVAAPTKSVGTNFDFHARTNDFAATCAYFHSDNLFNTIESLGFPIATFFDGTTFPVHVDHRAHFGSADGVEINAFCDGDGEGNGIGQVAFMLCDTTNTTEPFGRSVDKWVHWHEIGGHGILWDHVNSPNFGFAHSAGDGLAAIQIDPDSQLRTVAQRFQYAPFRPWPAGSERFFNRDVTAGWAWGGPPAKDDGQYGSEQILATCHFRVYQAMGGDSSYLSRRQFASRMMTWLILNTITKFNSGTNPDDAQVFSDKMIVADKDDWTTEGISGGAYGKVVRWSFEKQGCYQPVGAPTPVMQAGAPPEKDIYIEDGRHGEYPFLAVHWENPSVWNRTSSDGIYGHQSSHAGVDNFAYVRVKNRGTATATDVRVKLYHCKPGAGLVWPNDFEQIGPVDGLPITSIAGGSAEEKQVGPFTWIPNVNVYGHDCLLAISSCDGDPSNVDNFTAGDSIEEWRLVPNDNNIGQRNVNPAPGGESKALAEALTGKIFYAGNPFRRKADMQLTVELPNVLKQKGWELKFQGLSSDNRFTLAAGQKREIKLEMIAGQPFTADEVRASDRMIRVYTMANGIVMGGMSYELDPDMTKAPSVGDHAANDCKDTAGDLLKCLNLGDNKVKKVCVKKVSVDIELDNGCSC